MIPGSLVPGLVPDWLELVLRLSGIGLRLVSDRSQTAPRLVPDYFQVGPGFAQAVPQIGFRLLSDWCQIGPRLVPGRPQFDF